MNALNHLDVDRVDCRVVAFVYCLKSVIGVCGVCGNLLCSITALSELWISFNNLLCVRYRGVYIYSAIFSALQSELLSSWAAHDLPRASPHREFTIVHIACSHCGFQEGTMSTAPPDRYFNSLISGLPPEVLSKLPAVAPPPGSYFYNSILLLYPILIPNLNPFLFKYNFFIVESRYQLSFPSQNFLSSNY